MSIADDARLVALSSEPPRELFPLLDRAAAMAPLVVLMAIVPGMIGLVSARHGQPVDPAVMIPSAWGDWLVGIQLSVPGWDPALVSVVPSWLGVMLVVLAVYRLGRTLHGPRAAILIAAIACCHPPLLAASRVIAPSIVGVLLAIVAVELFLGHLQRSARTVSPRLLSAGIILGVCGLVSGGLVVVVLPLFAAALPCSRLATVGLWGEPSGVRPRLIRPMRAAVALATVIGVAATVLVTIVLSGGPIVESLASAFWRDWWFAPVGNAGPGLGRAMIVDACGRLGILGGPVLLGLIDAGGTWRRTATGRRTTAWFHLAWLVLGVATWAWAWWRAGPLLEQAGLAYAADWSRLFVLVPVILLAARGIDAICRRAVGVRAVVAACVVSPLVACGSHLVIVVEGGVGRAGWLFVAIAAGTAGLAWAAGRLCQGRERRQRRLLVTAVLAIVVANTLAGLLDLLNRPIAPFIAP